MWKERREPEFAKRKQRAEAGAIETVDGKGRRVTGTDAIAAEVAESEQALAAESTPGIVDVVDAAPSEPGAQARREKRRQRRSSRPHGRAR